MTIEDDVARIERRIAALKTYLASCVEDEDWHGVCDAANDLREAETELWWAKKWAEAAS